MMWQIYIDGASRNNPGLAGAGVYILKNGIPFLSKSYFLGIKTNNQAEYYALLLALYLIEPVLTIDDKLHIYSDSELLVRQMKAEYKVKNAALRILYRCAHCFLSSKNYAIHHLMREHNTVADKLANQGIDASLIPPREFESFCIRYQTI